MDSVFAAFYLLSNGNLFIAQKLIVQHLLIFRSDITLHDDCVGDLKLLWSVMKRYDSKFTKWLVSMVGSGSEEEVFPALKWYISWFTHSSITDFALVLRMFDGMLVIYCHFLCVSSDPIAFLYSDAIEPIAPRWTLYDHRSVTPQ